MDPYSMSCGASIENSTISHDELSKNLSMKMGVVPLQPSCSFKQVMASQFQDQDSSSTQSTGQSYSYPEVHRISETNRFGQAIVSTQTECNASKRKAIEVQVDSAVSMISQDSLFSPPQLDCRQSLNADPHFSGYMATYGSHQASISPLDIMGIRPPRVPLPFDPTSNEPIYVNPKQYHAILRRRKDRAKLEAQSKLYKDRKPYLHESRHLHAMRRVRGSGGRFLSAKRLQEESGKPATTSEGLGTRNSHSLINGDAGSKPPCSDVTTEKLFANPNASFSSYPSRSSVNGHKWLL